MSKFGQLLLLQWKNWTLQKRGVVKTIFEIGLPLFFILILVVLRVTKIRDEDEDAITYNTFDVRLLPTGLQRYPRIAFSPNTTEVITVISVVCKKLNLSLPKGFSSEDEMVDFLTSSFAQEMSISNYLGGIVFTTSPSDDKVKYKIRLSSRERNSKKQKDNLFVDQSTSWHTKFVFPQFQIPGPRNKESNHGGPPNYYEEGFLTLQHVTDLAIVEQRTARPISDVVINVRRFPYPNYIKDSFTVVIQQSLPALLMLSLVLTALNIVRSVVYEKERKLKVNELSG